MKSLLSICFVMFITYSNTHAMNFIITHDELYRNAESQNEKIKSDIQRAEEKIKETKSVKEIEKETIEQLQKTQKEYELLKNYLLEGAKQIELEKLQVEKSKEECQWK